jgi:hypothetical protein
VVLMAPSAAPNVAATGAARMSRRTIRYTGEMPCCSRRHDRRRPARRRARPGARGRLRRIDARTRARASAPPPTSPARARRHWDERLPGAARGDVEALAEERIVAEGRGEVEDARGGALAGAGGDEGRVHYGHDGTLSLKARDDGAGGRREVGLSLSASATRRAARSIRRTTPNRSRTMSGSGLPSGTAPRMRATVTTSNAATRRQSASVSAGHASPSLPL